MPDQPVVVHESAVPWQERSHGDRYANRRRQLGSAAGASDLGCSLYELPPGRSSWPYHFHHANEEAIYVLTGQGVIRLPDGVHPLRAGDYVALPRGPAGAHQVTAGADGPLRFLCLSTMRHPDVSVYPDTGKIGVFAGSAPGGSMERRQLEAFLRLDAKIGYWEGEE